MFSFADTVLFVFLQLSSFVMCKILHTQESLIKLSEKRARDERVSSRSVMDRRSCRVKGQIYKLVEFYLKEPSVFR
jgi:hypothetical protein